MRLWPRQEIEKIRGTNCGDHDACRDFRERYDVLPGEVRQDEQDATKESCGGKRMNVVRTDEPASDVRTDQTEKQHSTRQRHAGGADRHGEGHECERPTRYADSEAGGGLFAKAEHVERRRAAPGEWYENHEPNGQGGDEIPVRHA